MLLNVVVFGHLKMKNPWSRNETANQKYLWAPPISSPYEKFITPCKSTLYMLLLNGDSWSRFKNYHIQNLILTQILY